MEAQFIAATRNKLRFESVKGLLTVEDLWDLPLTGGAGKANLDDIAKALHRTLKETDDVSFVTPAQKADTSNQLKFEIVKQIIDVKIVERNQATAAAVRREQTQRVRQLLAEKQDNALASKSEDELKALLASLEAGA
jgi:hypothetical protein